MLAKAVKQHAPPQNLKGPSQQARGTTSSLQPSASSMLNAPRSTWSASKNPLKRTASQAMGGYLSTEAGKAPSRESSLSRHDSALSKSSIPELSQSSNYAGGRVGKLHDTVFFDENDFVDDDDLDLDSDTGSTSRSHPTNTDNTYPSTTANLTYPSTTTDLTYPSAATNVSYPSTTIDLMDPSTTKDVTYPSLPKPLPPTATPSKPPPSSVPIPWSSSPLYHRHPTGDAKALARNAAQSTSSSPQANTGKRRKLPWLEEKSDDRDEYQVDEALKQMEQSGPPAKVLKIMEAQRKRKALAKTGSEQNYTPLPKDKADSSYPWNKTASAVKEEQKVLRQGHKKLVKDIEANAETKVKTTKDKKVPRVFLSDEQRKVLTLVAEGKKSVFFTGSAGTGKSVLLRETIRVLRDKHKREIDRVAVTASTGLAACNVGGVTLHSFAGIGLGKEEVPELVKKIKRNQKAKLRWMRTKVLIVDEISMVDGDLFDKLEAIARTIRNNGRPFGGIQLIITGDFFQLPPVPDYGRISKFAFDAATWNTSIDHTIGLTQVFRQKDPVFANMLNEMRLGKLSNQSINAFRNLNRPLTFNDDFQATELFPTRNEVEAANNGRMRSLSGKSFEFIAEDGGAIADKVQRDKLLANCMAPQTISLKKGAQVMLIKNIDETLVNGSIGKVIAFMDEKMFDIYHDDEDEFQAAETMDLNDDEMSESRKKLKAMINKDLAGDTSRKWPLVRFAIADGTSRDLLCQRESWKIELPNGEVQASRSQIPLILAWALSIHKAQGQTLERVKVDLGRIFEKGQAYVALSRATCQEGLQIMRFDPKKVMAHDKVRSFYDSLYSVEETKSAATAPANTGREPEEDYPHGGMASDEDDDALQEMYG